MTEAESEKRIDGVTGSSGRLITRVSPGHFKIVATAEGYGLAVQRTIVKAGNVEAVIKLYPRENSNSVLPIPLPITGHKWETPPLWQPQPALIIGMGGTGRHVLTHLKKNLLDAGAGKIADTVRFVLLDTSDYELLEGQQVSVSFAGVSLSAEDIVEFGDDLNPLKEALLRDPKSEPEMSGWFPAANYHTRLAPDELNLAHGTRQRRPPARATLVRDLKKGLPTKGTNVILLIGRSETMGNPFSVGDSSISKLEAAKQATVHLVEQLNLSLDRVAVIQFDENAEIICPFSQDRKIIRNSIEGIQPGRGISLHKGLQIAQQLSTERGGDETFPAVILVTDAQSYPESTLESAQALKQSGTRLVVIGLDNANENLLRQVVTCTNNAPHYYKALDSLEISRICKSLARQLGEGSQLWRLISGAARDSMDGDELRIILVGSLAGGYGSAILTDIAYLTRHAGYFLGAKSVSVEAYLVTDGAFVHSTPRLETNAVNTYASLRELERFQLAQGYPFRMTYREESTNDAVLAGIINWRLLDELYLFDTLPTPSSITPVHEKLWHQPSASIFPAIADMITLWLDKASRAGALSEYRRSIQGEVTGEQHSVNRAVVGGLGIFTYRLPMYDIFELLKVRWSRAVLHDLFGTGTLPEVDQGSNSIQEQATKNISRHVCLFLLGCAGYEGTYFPPVSQVIGLLASEGVYPELEEEIKKIEFAENFDDDAKAFYEYLTGALLSILNSQNSESETARGNRIRYALLFLETLEQLLIDGRNNLGGSYTQLESLIGVYHREAQGLKQNLDRLIPLFWQTKSPKSDGQLPSLIDRLEEIEIKCQKHLGELNGLIARKYVFSEEMLNRWYHTYFLSSPFRQEMFSRLYWVVDEKGKITLALKSWEDHLLHEDNASQQRFVNELLRLAGYAGRELLQKETLASVLAETVFLPENIAKTSDELRTSSQPILRYDGIKAKEARWALALCTNPTVRQREELGKFLVQGLPGERKLRNFDITDPFSLFLAQMVDVIPLSAINSLNYAEQTYRRWYGLLPNTSADPRAEPTPVFRAERVALLLEQRLQTELHLASHLLHPIVVSALGGDREANIYALALAAGWIRKVGSNVMIFPGEEGEILATAILDEVSHSLHPLVLGFVCFSAQATTNQVQVIQRRITENEPNILSVWRPWTSPNWQQQPLAAELLSSGPAAADLAIVVTLFVRDEFRRRAGTL